MKKAAEENPDFQGFMKLCDEVRKLKVRTNADTPDDAARARAFGADYIANILRQQQVRRDVQPPLRLKDPVLNELATDPLSLAEYDAFILRSRKESHDLPASETESAQPDHDEPPTGSDDR